MRGVIPWSLSARDQGHPAFWIGPRDLTAVDAEMCERTMGPGHGEAQALLGTASIGGVFGALIESHGDVGAEGNLDVH